MTKVAFQEVAAVDQTELRHKAYDSILSTASAAIENAEMKWQEAMEDEDRLGVVIFDPTDFITNMVILRMISRLLIDSNFTAAAAHELAENNGYKRYHNQQVINEARVKLQSLGIPLELIVGLEDDEELMDSIYNTAAVQIAQGIEEAKGAMIRESLTQEQYSQSGGWVAPAPSGFQ